MAGVVGRTPFPSKVHVLGGNVSKKSLTELLDNFSPDVALPECPPHLLDEAAAEYRRMGAEMLRYNLVCELDRGVLAMAATEWGRYVWAEQKIAQLNAEDVKNGERGLVASTPNGYKVMSVYVQIANAAIAMYLKLVAELGLSPAARSRVKPIDSPQGDLFPRDGGEQGQRASIRSFAA